MKILLGVDDGVRGQGSSSVEIEDPNLQESLVPAAPEQGHQQIGTSGTKWEFSTEWRDSSWTHRLKERQRP